MDVYTVYTAYTCVYIIILCNNNHYNIIIRQWTYYSTSLPVYSFPVMHVFYTKVSICQYQSPPQFIQCSSRYNSTVAYNMSFMIHVITF